MYKQKSEIIGRIQSYHEQVAELYSSLYKKIGDNDLKLIVNDLYKHEKFREKYLAKHKEVAKAMDFWLDFPCEKLSQQISDCLKNVHMESEITMGKLLEIRMHFDDCLIKIYNILASENELSETVTNVFYYMLKKTKKEKTLLAEMLYNSKSKLPYNYSEQSI
jgi:hypothetical protein